MNWFRTALRAALVLLVAGAAAVAYLSYSPIGDNAPHPFNQDRNAVWLEHRWLEREHPTRKWRRCSRVYRLTASATSSRT